MFETTEIIWPELYKWKKKKKKKSVSEKKNVIRVMQ